jgi:hypothetical protein
MKPPSADALLKAYADLWMHHNRLMYDRYQTLYLIQAGFLALAFYLQGNRELAIVVLVAEILFSLIVFSWAYDDMRLRNLHRHEMLKLGVDPTLAPPDYQRRAESGGEFAKPIVIFAACMAADAFLGYVLWSA